MVPGELLAELRAVRAAVAAEGETILCRRAAR